MTEVYTKYKEAKEIEGMAKISFSGIFSKIETQKTFNTELYIRKDKKVKILLKRENLIYKRCFLRIYENSHLICQC